MVKIKQFDINLVELLVLVLFTMGFYMMLSAMFDQEGYASDRDVFLIFFGGMTMFEVGMLVVVLAWFKKELDSIESSDSRRQKND